MSAAALTVGWSRFFGIVPESTPDPRVARPPHAPQRPPALPCRPCELDWLAGHLPASLGIGLLDALDKTLRFRVQWCGPLDAPKEPVERTRFGLFAEPLWSIPLQDLRKLLRAELRESIRTLETPQPRLPRNGHLAMHGVRIGQLCWVLTRRRVDVLEELRNGLALLWG